MIKAIMAADDIGGVSLGESMPWPKNSNDLQWFKKNTLNQIVVMGRNTWVDPFMPTPLISRINVLITNKEPKLFPGADYYLKGDLKLEIENLKLKFSDKDIFVIGGADIINQSLTIVKEFYLTRIYGNYKCDKFINLEHIKKNMKLIKKIECDETCHFEIWKK
tara:strand:- start:264 stop:752 length:489 start_codon:yes stop_codon:yes gene_type:complete